MPGTGLKHLIPIISFILHVNSRRWTLWLYPFCRGKLWLKRSTWTRSLVAGKCLESQPQPVWVHSQSTNPVFNSHHHAGEWHEWGTEVGMRKLCIACQDGTECSEQRWMTEPLLSRSFYAWIEDRDDRAAVKSMESTARSPGLKRWLAVQLTLSLNFLVPQSPSLQNGNNDQTYLIGLLKKWGDIKSLKHTWHTISTSEY